MYSAVDPPLTTPAALNNVNMDEEEDESDSEAETARNSGPVAAAATAVEPSELMQLEMSEDIRVGSPDDGSNNLDSDFHLLAVSHPSDHHQHRRADSYRAESTRRWDDPALLQLPPASGNLLLIVSYNIIVNSNLTNVTHT